MNFYDIAAILITLAALFSYLNYRYIRFPSAIGLMALSLVFSLVLLGLGVCRTFHHLNDVAGKNETVQPFVFSL